MSNQPFALGADPSPEDPRTIKSTDLALALAVPPFHKKDYAGFPHKDQMRVGICTAAAVSAAAEKFFGDPNWRGSMEWLYKIGKMFIDGNTTEGSSAFTMLKAAQKYGIPSESKFPSNCNRSYTEFMQNLNITQAMLDDAAKHKIPGYASVPMNVDALVQAIYASRSGLVTRMTVGNEWWTDSAGNWTNDPAKLQPLRAPKVIISGHLIVQNGYELGTNDVKFIDRNSWGDNWCDKGDIYFYFKNLIGYFTEAWTIVGRVLFANDLRMGTIHADVKRLQEFLNTHGFPVAPAGNGSPGNETTYFGLLTFNALKKFQAANGIPNTGYFGPLTRAKVNVM